MARKRKAKRNRHAPIPGGLVAHGAFASKADAEAKRRKLGKGGFVVRKFARWGGRGRPMSTRYCVFTRDTATEFNFA